MKIAVVTFADTRVERYELGVVRMKHALKWQMPTADFVCFNTFAEIGSPTHDAMPYAFKAFAIASARAMGYDVILWCDSVINPIKNLVPIFDHIINNGYVFFDNIGYTIGYHTSDKCLELMGMSREESFNSKMLMACVMGFDLRNETVNKIIDSYLFHATSGAYAGGWHNNSKLESQHEGVHGHRHDQSVISILVHQNKLNVLTGHETFFAYAKGSLPIGNSVSLLSE